MPWSVQNVIAYIVDIIGSNGGLFVYNGAAAHGTLVASIAATAGTDPYGNPYQAGIFLYETSGNALIGMMWNTIVGSQPLLALFPDSTVGFTDHSPFILAQVFNRGLANEQLALSLGGGAGSGSVSPVMYNLFSVSADGTLLAHHTFYGGALGNELADLSNTGLQIINQVDGNTYRAGHQILIATASTTINNTTPIQVNNLSTNVAVGSYMVKGYLRCVAAASGVAQVLVPRVNGSCTVSSMRIAVNEYAEVGGTTINPSTIAALNTDPAVLPGVIANNTVFAWTLEGVMTISAAGTFGLFARVNLSNADETFTVQANSWLELIPV